MFGYASTPYYSQVLNKDIFQVQPFGVIDTGSQLADDALASVVSVANAGITLFNGIINAASLPSRVGGWATDRTAEQFDNEVSATINSAGPLALPVQVGSLALRAPRLLNKFSRTAKTINKSSENINQATNYNDIPYDIAGIDLPNTNKITTEGISGPLDTNNVKNVSNSIAPSGNLFSEATTLSQQRELANLTNQARTDLVGDFDKLLSELSPAQVDAIADEPWRMKLFFGTAIETRVARQVDIKVQDNPESVLSGLSWTGKTNAPQDFIDSSGFGFDITGGSVSSIMKHQNRSGIDTVITYDSIADDLGYKFIDWLENN